jgi:hypothetical protein
LQERMQLLRRSRFRLVEDLLAIDKVTAPERHLQASIKSPKMKCTWGKSPKSFCPFSSFCMPEQCNICVRLQGTWGCISMTRKKALNKHPTTMCYTYWC